MGFLCAFLICLICLCSSSAAFPQSELENILQSDECDEIHRDSGECALTALQLRGIKLDATRLDAASLDQVSSRKEILQDWLNFTEQRKTVKHDTPDAYGELQVYEPVNEEGRIDYSAVEQLGAGAAWNPFKSQENLHPINAFNKYLDSVKFLGVGLYYQFDNAEGQKVWSGQIEGRPGSWSNAKTPFPLASASKLFTAFAAMYTMQLKPREFYPEKFINEFKGWEDFKQFSVVGTSKKADLTVHQLLTHTSGLPFSMRVSKDDIIKQKLFFWPGTGFGYTLGHRVIGWLLRDFWKEQPEATGANLETLGDTLRWLYFDKLGLSDETKFSDAMRQAFGFEGDAGDASLQSTGEDMMKLALVALNKGKLPDGTRLISEANWDKWAIPNLLPGGKLSKDLTSWEGASASWANWNVGGMKSKIMKQSGDYGWNYFGATYFDSKEIGWCGFFSSCLRVTYPQDLAFVMMQEDVADMKKSKPYLVSHFNLMAKSLQCSFKRCGVTLYCQRCDETRGGWFSKTKYENCRDQPWIPACPSSTRRWKVGLGRDEELQNISHTCYVPRCSGS